MLNDFAQNAQNFFSEQFKLKFAQKLKFEKNEPWKNKYGVKNRNISSIVKVARKMTTFNPPFFSMCRCTYHF